MLIKEYLIEPRFFQEIVIPETANVLKVIILSEGQAVLLVEDLQDGCIEERKVGIYIVASEDLRANEIPENYMYINSLRMSSEFGVLLFHVYIESIDLTDLFPEMDSEPLGGY